jgi:hypothetical protein
MREGPDPFATMSQLRPPGARPFRGHIRFAISDSVVLDGFSPEGCGLLTLAGCRCSPLPQRLDERKGPCRGFISGIAWGNHAGSEPNAAAIITAPHSATQGSFEHSPMGKVE